MVKIVRIEEKCLQHIIEVIPRVKICHIFFLISGFLRFFKEVSQRNTILQYQFNIFQWIKLYALIQSVKKIVL